MGKWLTIEEKYELVMKHRRCPTLSQAKLARWAQTAFNLERVPSPNTVRQVLQSAAEIEEKRRLGITKRGRDVTCPELEAALKRFVETCEVDQVRLSRKLLAEKARQILDTLPNAPPMALSVGWLTNFMARHNIRFREFRRRRGGLATAVDLSADHVGDLMAGHSEMVLSRSVMGPQMEPFDNTAVQRFPAPRAFPTAIQAQRTVLITGANRGIGLAFVRHYIQQGWRVIATARSVDKAEELKSLGPWKLIPLDTSVQQSISVAAKALEGVAVDLLINNAGIAVPRGLDATTPEDCMRQFEVNALGPFLMTRAFLPNLRLAVELRGEAYVAQITSRLGSISDDTSGGSYGFRVSKSALNMFTKNLAVDLQPQHIGCLLLHPGFVNTSINNFTGVVDPEESVAGMARLIERANVNDPVAMLHFGKGDTIDW